MDFAPSVPGNGGSELIDLHNNGTARGMVIGTGGRRKPVVWRTEGHTEIFDEGYYDERYLRLGNGSGLIVGQYPGSSLGWARSADVLACVSTPAGCGFAALYLASIALDVNEAGVIAGQRTLTVPGESLRYEAYTGMTAASGQFMLSGLGLYQGQFDTAALANDNLGRIAGFATLNAAGALQQALL